MALAHVILHLGLCSAMMKAPAQTQFAVRVRMLDHGGTVAEDEVFHITRGYSAQQIVDFSTGQGLYKLIIQAPKANCTGQDYLALLPDRTRNVNEQLVDGVAPGPQPMLFQGTAPQAFLYAKPTFVLLDKSTQCDKPVGDEIPVNINVENDQDAFYAWMYSDPSIAARSGVVMAMRLTTPTGEYHDIRVKFPFPQPWDGFPYSITFNVTEDMVDALAGDPVDTLLCPRLWRTSVGG